MGRLQCVLEDSGGTLWVGTAIHGVVEITEGTPRLHGVDVGLHGKTVSCLYEDRDGGIWVGTRGGLSRRVGSSFERVLWEFAGGDPVGVQALAEGVDGTVWIGTRRAGLLCVRGGGLEELRGRSPVLQRAIQCLYVDPVGRVWAGTDGGLACLDGEDATVWDRRRGLASNDVRSLSESSDGTLWVGTSAGVSILWEGEASTLEVRGLLLDRSVEAILVDRHDRVWVAVESDLARLHDGVVRVFSSRDGLPGGLVRTLHEDRGGAIWVGTDDGIARYDGERFVRPAGDVPDLRGSEVRGILEDRSGHLWIAARFGVLLYDGTTHQRVPLPEDWIDASGARALLQTRDGDVWLGLYRGGAVRWRSSPDRPALALVEVATESRRGLAAAREVSTSSFVALDFQGISFTTPASRLKYRYRLSGHDDEWTYTSTPRIEYRGLDSGDYELEVQAIDSDLDYSETQRVAIRVHLPYYDVAVWCALAIAAAVLAWQAVRLVSRNRALEQLGGALEQRVRERTIRLEETRSTLEEAKTKLRRLAARLITVQEEERRRLARELHDDLTQQLASLGMEAEILRAQVREGSAEVDPSLRELGERSRALAKRAGELARHLHPTLLADIGLVKAVESECADFEKRTGISLQCEAAVSEGALAPEVALSVFRILQESLHNIEKHADAQDVDVMLTQGDGEVRLAVRDFGRGFDASGEQTRGGLGLTSMEERAILVGGSVEVSALPGEGTLVELRIPTRSDDD